VYRSKFRCRVHGCPEAFSSCSSPKAAPSSDGSKFHASSSKMNWFVVVDPVEILPVVVIAPLRPEEVQLGPPVPIGGGRSARVPLGLLVEQQHPAPPPAHVMMWDEAKLVTLKSDRVPVGVPA